MTDQPTPEAVALALTVHRTESMMTAEHCFGWQCLTCSAEGHSWSCIESAEQAALGHHAASVLTFIRDAIHRDGPDANAIRRALGLWWVKRESDIAPVYYSPDERPIYRARRLVGDWQEKP
jgi:hypothetical protein